MKNNVLRKVALILAVITLPAIGLIFAQVGGGGSTAAIEAVDTTAMPQTKQEKIAHFQQLRATCVQQGNTAAVAYCDWALGYLD